MASGCQLWMRHLLCRASISHKPAGLGNSQTNSCRIPRFVIKSKKPAGIRPAAEDLYDGTGEAMITEKDGVFRLEAEEEKTDTSPIQV